MIFGHVRDSLPRLAVTLPGQAGPLRVELVVDTGFEGELALPSRLLSRLHTAPLSSRRIRLADGSEQFQPVHLAQREWAGEARNVEILTLEGAPLLGSLLMTGFLLQVEMTDGGEVSLEPL